MIINMKAEVDLFFTYKYTIRYLLSHKLINNFNTYTIPNISKIIIYFSLKKFEDLDSVEIYNYFYLFRQFFGRKAFLSKTKSQFSLGKWYYNFNISLILNKPKDIYTLLFFFFNNIFKKIDQSFINKGFLTKKLNIFYFIIKDMNIFSELKTNLGLFNLKKHLNINIFFLGLDYKASRVLLKNIKILI